jgi:hypothetical protein
MVQTPFPRKLLILARKGIDRLMTEDEESTPSEEEMISSILKDNPTWDEKVLRQLLKDAKE